MINIIEPWGDWTSWSHCSKTCGYGKKHRSRRCNAIPGIDGKFKICEIGKIEGDNQMCDMGPCGSYAKEDKGTLYGSDDGYLGEKLDKEKEDRNDGNYHHERQTDRNYPEEKYGRKDGSYDHEGKQLHYRSESEEMDKKYPEEKHGNYHRKGKEPHYHSEDKHKKYSGDKYGQKGSRYDQEGKRSRYPLEDGQMDKEFSKEKDGREDEWRRHKKPEQINQFPHTSAVKVEIDEGSHRLGSEVTPEDEKKSKQTDKLPSTSAVKEESDNRFEREEYEELVKVEEESKEVDLFPDTSAVKVDSERLSTSDEDLDYNQNYELDNVREDEAQYSPIEEEIEYEEA